MTDGLPPFQSHLAQEDEDLEAPALETASAGPAHRSHSDDKGQRLGRQAQIPLRAGFEEVSPVIAPLNEPAPSIARLNSCYGQADPLEILDAAIHKVFPRRIVAVSAFGSESALLLSMIAEVAPRLPILFLDTGKHFPETLAYRNRLVDHLGLENLQNIAAAPQDLFEEDPQNDLSERDADACCHLRKVVPLERALSGFDAWISGRKRYQGGARQDLSVFSKLGGRIQVNPLAHWQQEDIAKTFAARGLPPHPLTAQGYRSIGCASCTVRTQPGADSRSGRWPGQSKSECGIHWVNGKLVRSQGSQQP